MIQRVLAPFRGFVVGRPPKCGLGRADQRYLGSGGLRQNPIVTGGLGNYAETQDQPSYPEGRRFESWPRYFKRVAYAALFCWSRSGVFSPKSV